ncbi:MAG: aldehyde dehydrogenase family protein, partial [Ignavibacteria bacterium]|nr:aldehyde dehydrogenase family protein [Ignavibacteria bacterium]
MTFREKAAPAAGRSSAGNESRSNGSARKSVWEYAPSAESADHILLKDKYDLFINGKWVKTKKYFPTINPATEEKIAEVSWASKDDVNRAVLAAEKAYNNVWSKTSPKERAKYIFRIARIMQEKAREFAVIETMDGGKPIKESKSVDV